MGTRRQGHLPNPQRKTRRRRLRPRRGVRPSGSDTIARQRSCTERQPQPRRPSAASPSANDGDRWRRSERPQACGVAGVLGDHAGTPAQEAGLRPPRPAHAKPSAACASWSRDGKGPRAPSHATVSKAASPTGRPTARAAAARFAEILRNAVPNTNPIVGCEPPRKGAARARLRASPTCPQQGRALRIRESQYRERVPIMERPSTGTAQSTARSTSSIITISCPAAAVRALTCQFQTDDWIASRTTRLRHDMNFGNGERVLAELEECWGAERLYDAQTAMRSKGRRQRR